MTMTGEDLDLITSTREVVVETRSNNRTYRTVIWVVVDDGAILIRSVRGENGRWYQRALIDPAVALIIGERRFEFTAVPVSDPGTIEQTSQAFQQKYGKSRSLDSMLRPEVLGTTLLLEPKV